MIGDLVATVKVETPKVLDEEYKKLLEQLAELEKKVITPSREAWGKKVTCMQLNSRGNGLAPIRSSYE